MIKSGFISLATASLLTTSAFAAVSNGDGSVGSKDDNTSIVIADGTTTWNVENVYIETNSTNLFTGSEIRLDLPAGVTVVGTPNIVSGELIFGSSDYGKVATVSTLFSGNQRISATVDKNASLGVDSALSYYVSIEDIFVTVASGTVAVGNANDLNATIGIVDTNGTVESLSNNVRLAKLYTTLPIPNIIETTTLGRVIPTTTSIVANSDDDADYSLLLTVPAGAASGSTITLTLDNGTFNDSADDENGGYLDSLTDASDTLSSTNTLDVNATDANATMAVSSGVLTITLDTKATNESQLRLDLSLSDLNGTGLTSGTAINVQLAGTAGLSNSFALATAKTNGTTTTVVSGAADDNVTDVNLSATTAALGGLYTVTKGAAYAAYINPIKILENFITDVNGSMTLTLGGGATWAVDATPGALAVNGIVYSEVNTTSVARASMTYADNNMTIVDGNRSATTSVLNLNFAQTDGLAQSHTVASDFNDTALNRYTVAGLQVLIPETFTGSTVELTVAAGTNVGQSITSQTVTVANVATPSIQLDTNVTSEKVGIGTSQVLRLDINESVYGSLAATGTGATRLSINGLGGITLEDPGATGVTTGTDKVSTHYSSTGAASAELDLLQSGTQIDADTIRYTITTESDDNQTQYLGGVRHYIDLNITTPSTMAVGDAVEVELVHEDGTNFGKISLATVGNAGIVSAADVN